MSEVSGGPWWKTGVIYQIPVPSFADSNDDGLGDLRGVLGRLDHLRGGDASLEVDAVWLTPVNTSPLRDFGYDVADTWRSIRASGRWATSRSSFRRVTQEVCDW